MTMQHRPTSQPRLLALAVHAAMLAMPLASLAALPQVAQAQTVQVTHNFNIPAGVLSTALTQLAAQAGLQLTANAEITAGKSAPAVSGNLTARQALDRLLAGSGLAASVDRNGIVIRKLVETSETSLPPVIVTSSRSDIEQTSLHKW